MISDGTATYGYDALKRMIGSGGATYSYNGDGVLVYDGTTRYTQDLASPLTQILQTTQGSVTTNYLYGLDRLVAKTGRAKAWYATDALGSVRQTLSNTGAPLGVVSYDPWGTVESGTVPMFGFTGELQSGGLVDLRARWYSTGQGRFAVQDMWAGEPRRPSSFNRYNYTANNPINRTDPTGYDWEDWYFNWSLVRDLKEDIKRLAKFHERPADGFSWEVVASLMAAHIAREKRG